MNTLREELVSLILSRDDRQHGVGASDTEIARAEAALALPITGDYREFLRLFGWLTWGPLEIYGLGEGVPKYADLVDVTISERIEMQPPLPPDLLPVNNDGAGNLYCLETGGHRRGRVVFWDHTLGAAQETQVVAPCFQDWLMEQLAAAALSSPQA